jgi:hypothetical protein
VSSGCDDAHAGPRTTNFSCVVRPCSPPLAAVRYPLRPEIVRAAHFRRPVQLRQLVTATLNSLALRSRMHQVRRPSYAPTQVVRLHCVFLGTVFSPTLPHSAISRNLTAHPSPHTPLKFLPTKLKPQDPSLHTVEDLTPSYPSFSSVVECPPANGRLEACFPDLPYEDPWGNRYIVDLFVGSRLVQMGQK